MRLLNTETLEVEEFIGKSVPEYAILSHTWGTGEVTLQDIRTPEAAHKEGYKKIKNCCRKATEDGFQYCWIDTCCIDKTSSAELCEAINSMYQYYADSVVCYVYLSDMENANGEQFILDPEFKKCRWWTRGWTLQELIAPRVVEFYDSKWTQVGTKLSLRKVITYITGIDEDILSGESDPYQRNVAVRMSWAAPRTTTRVEDRAYSLMGIFGVHMSLIYGEGQRAFIRLQEEIMRVHEDYTIFAWYNGSSSLKASGTMRSPLAFSPSSFDDNRWWEGKDTPSDFSGGSMNYLPRYNDLLPNFSVAGWLRPSLEHETPRITSRGLRISLPLKRVSERYIEETSFLGGIEKHSVNESDYIACLTPVKDNFGGALLCAWLTEDQSMGHFTLTGGEGLFVYPKAMSDEFLYRTIYIAQPEIRTLTRQFRSNLPGLVVAKVIPTSPKATFSCRSPTWINLEELERLYESKEPRTEEERVKKARWDWLRFRPEFWRLQDLVSPDMPLLAHGHDHQNCWISTVQSPERVPHRRHIRGELIFESTVYPDLAFAVVIEQIYEKLVLTLMHFVKGQYSEIVDSPRQIDRVSAIIYTSSALRPNLSIIANIRQIASGPLGISRFVLSLSCREISGVCVEANTTTEVVATESWSNFQEKEERSRCKAGNAPFWMRT